MYRLASALLAVADYALLRSVACTPRVCDGCGRTWRRLTPTQHTHIGAGLLATCRRWTCDGRLHPVWEPTPANERFLRDVLRATPDPISLMKNGAPGATGTPSEQAAPLKGSTAMHTIEHESTPRGKQMTAALTLARLLELGLPDAEWRITTDGRLYGHVNLPGQDLAARGSIDAYANFFRSLVVSEDVTGAHATWTHLSTAALYRGTRVDVWTHVAVRAITPEVTA